LLPVVAIIPLPSSKLYFTLPSFGKDGLDKFGRTGGACCCSICMRGAFTLYFTLLSFGKEVFDSSYRILFLPHVKSVS
jgi:hypothetical protein